MPQRRGPLGEDVWSGSVASGVYKQRVEVRCCRTISKRRKAFKGGVTTFKWKLLSISGGCKEIGGARRQLEPEKCQFLLAIAWRLIQSTKTLSKTEN